MPLKWRCWFLKMEWNLWVGNNALCLNIHINICLLIPFSVTLDPLLYGPATSTSPLPFPNAFPLPGTFTGMPGFPLRTTHPTVFPGTTTHVLGLGSKVPMPSVLLLLLLKTFFLLSPSVFPLETSPFFPQPYLSPPTILHMQVLSVCSNPTSPLYIFTVHAGGISHFPDPPLPSLLWSAYMVTLWVSSPPGTAPTGNYWTPKFPLLVTVLILVLHKPNLQCHHSLLSLDPSQTFYLISSFIPVSKLSQR